jgi:hypothetical protein
VSSDKNCEKNWLIWYGKRRPMDISIVSTLDRAVVYLAPYLAPEVNTRLLRVLAGIPSIS